MKYQIEFTEKRTLTVDFGELTEGFVRTIVQALVDDKIDGMWTLGDLGDEHYEPVELLVTPVPPTPEPNPPYTGEPLGYFSTANPNVPLYIKSSTQGTWT